MFNGCNETALISYEVNQERVEKKHENVSKWSYEFGVQQQGQTQPSNRPPEFWPGKSNFLGIPNVVKCSCTGCYPSTEKQSYQGETRHRPWLPRTYPVPASGCNEPCKLPGYQWDNGLSHQNSSYVEPNLPYAQENGGKYSYYKHFQSSRLESNQPGVITSVKNVEKPKESGGRHQPVFCNPGYPLTPPKRADGRNYCDGMEKYSNTSSYSVDHHQHVGRGPLVEPFTKTVPSNLSQSRVPSAGFRSVKENMPMQAYVDLGYEESGKMCTELPINGEKRLEGFSGEYSHYSRDCLDADSQKLYYDNTRHSDYYSKNNYQEVVKRNNQTLENRKDCVMSQINELGTLEGNYNITRLKYQETLKPSCDAFYPKDFDKGRLENSCFPRTDDGKNETMNVPRVPPPSALFLNDPRFPDRTQNSFTYPTGSVGYRNYIGREYQVFNSNQPRYEYPTGVQRNDLTYRGPSQQIQQECGQLTTQQGGQLFPLESPMNSEKALYGGKNPQFVQTDSMPPDIRNPTFLEPIRGEVLNKTGGTKISPLRLLRKKKFINVPQETAPVSSLNAVPGLDVRKFWSTWAEEEEENVAPTQVVVLDCQNIDPEQAKLLHFYDTDPVPLDTNSQKSTAGNEETTNEDVKTCEQGKTHEETTKKEGYGLEQDETEKGEQCNLTTVPETAEMNCQKTDSAKHFKKGKSGKENRGKQKTDTMDKWTEKKFDFLKRAEESKAAEILRHEEEKKKLFERRASLQKSLKKMEEKKGVDSEGVSPFDENSNSPECGNPEVPHLPTSEYRRNKFLDYSMRKENANGETQNVYPEPEIEKKEKTNLQLENSLKEESEMDDILQKISEMNFQCPLIKFENDLEETKSKKMKKTKRKKQENQPEDVRTDELTVETATKPTIKFSIQKSHDLKISFKVLNSTSKEYSDEDLGGEDADDTNGTPEEDSKNSTELITFKYKTIQRDGDEMSESKKSRRRKKQNSKMLKMKKKKYTHREEKDPLAVEEDALNILGKCSEDDGFQVQETMDSAKIKLTFKRHKGNFETEYKINSSSNVEKVGEVEEKEKTTEKKRKKVKELRKAEVFGEAGLETFSNGHETSDAESSPEAQKSPLDSVLEEDSRKSSNSRSSIGEEINCNFQRKLSTFPEFPSAIQNEPSEEKEKNVEIKKNGEDLAEFTLINPLSEDKVFSSNDKSSDHVDEDRGKGQNSEEEKMKEISFEFIKSTKESESNDHSERAVGDNGEPLMRKNYESSYESTIGCAGRSEKAEEEMCCTFEISRDGTKESLYESATTPAGLPLDLTNEENSENTSDGRLEVVGEEITKMSKKLGEGDFKILIENFTDDTKCGFLSVGSNSSTPKTCQEFSLPPFIPLNCSDEKSEELEKPKIEFQEDVTYSQTEGSPQSDFEILFQKPEDYPPKNVFEGSSEVFENSVNVDNFFDNKDSCQNDFNKSGKEILNENVDFVPIEDEKIVEEVWVPKELECEGEGLNSAFSNSWEEIPEDTKELSVEPVTDHEKEVKVSEETQEKTEFKMSEVEEENLEKRDVTKISLSFPVTSDPDQSILNHVTDDLPEGSCLSDEAPPEEVTDDKLTQNEGNSDVELEDGEIVDSREPSVSRDECSTFEFLVRKIERRHSVNHGVLDLRTESRKYCNKKFSKANSCPPKLKFEEEELKKQKTPTSFNIPVEDIPLPLGPPQYENCFDLTTYINLNKMSVSQTEANDKTEKSKEVVLSSPPPLQEAKQPSHTGLFQRNSKIKFSFLKRSKHSKCLLNIPNDLSKDNETKIKGKSEMLPARDEQSNQENEKIFTEEPKVELSCGNLDETVEAIESVNDFVRDEFYECEDIPTSEDLTNGEDLDNGKVNDDKFRNIMQNCLDNAKKFLNVGNLKLFSCSVDDLLDLDCQESSVESTVAHISRDVLLASCEDTNEDLGLGENIQPTDISVDFVPSFCTDEILPVDNWPYLEEEVPSSPTLSKSEETDLIATLNSSTTVEGRKEVMLKRIRRKSLLPEPVNNCSKIQRRNTFAGVTCGKNIRDLKKDLIRWKKEAVEAENKTLKCRLSLDKITRNNLSTKSKETIKNLDYKSPTWQPKVMLFRISKNELRKVLESSKMNKRLSSDDILKRKSQEEPKNKVASSIKKKFDGKPEEEVIDDENQKFIDLLKLDTIKGSLTSGDPEKRKKSRFRNLHTKKKPETTSGNRSPAREKIPEMFKDGRVNSNTEKTKIHKTDEEKLKRKPVDGKTTPILESRQERTKEKSEHERRDKRKEKKKERDEGKHKTRESEEGKCDRQETKFPNGSKRFKRDSEEKRRQEFDKNGWVCEVCGFNDASERVLHIKSHPFHCQSCHLAFKTEAHFIGHLTKKHKDIRNQHHCLLCELSFDTEDQYQGHLETREHKHLESVEKNTINTLFTLLTGAPCPVFGLLEMKPEWLPNQAGTVHFYHQATPLSLALQYLKMHHELMTFSTPSSAHPN